MSSFSEEEEADAGDFLCTDEGTRLVRAQRLARARKNALAVSLGRVDERETIHRKLKSSSVRAEVTQLSEQLKKKEGDLKEARLYIQRLELRIAENKDKSKENDKEKEIEAEKGEKERKEIGDVKTRLRQVERVADDLKQTTSLELSRLLQLIVGAERLIDTHATHGNSKNTNIPAPPLTVGGEHGNGRALQGLLLKARHALENLLRTVSQSAQVQENGAIYGDGMTSTSIATAATAVAAAAETKDPNTYPSASASLPTGDRQYGKDAPFVSAQDADSPTSTASLTADATSFINARRTILEKSPQRGREREQEHGQQWLVGSLLDMCQVLESENLRLKQQQQSSQPASFGSGIKDHFIPQQQQQYVQKELHQMRRLVSHYRTAILSLQQDHTACLEELASERELSAAVKAQLSALHRRGNSSSSSSSSLSTNKGTTAGANRARKPLPDHDHRRMSSAIGQLQPQSQSQSRSMPTSASASAPDSPSRIRTTHTFSADIDASVSTDLYEHERDHDHRGGASHGNDDLEGTCSSPPGSREGDMYTDGGGGEIGRQSQSAHSSHSALTGLPDAQLIQTELKALDQEIASLREKLRQAALEKTSAIMSSALGAAVGISSGTSITATHTTTTSTSAQAKPKDK